MTAEPIHLTNATPFDLIAETADDLLTEARAWADGKAVETQPQADDVSRLIDELRKIAKTAEDQRKVENKPYDDAKAAIQTKYAPLFADPKNKVPGKVFKAVDALKATLQPFLAKLDAEKREAERKAREAADQAARDAAEAMRAAAASNLEAREEAEAKVREAEAAERAARQAATDKAHATGGDRAMGLRSVWKATVTDARSALAHYYRINPDAFLPLVQKLADDDVRSGKRSGVAGVEFIETRVL